MFKRVYKSSIGIKSSSTEVWHILTDFNNYHLWNSFTPVIIAKSDIGSKVEMLVRLGEDNDLKKQVEYMREFQPPVRLAWGMRWLGLLTALRVQEIQILEDNILYTTTDTISGLLTPLVHLLHGKAIQKGFDDVASGLKKYAETNVGKLKAK